MMVPRDEEKVVEYLKEFRPRSAKALVLPRARVSVAGKLAFAAVAAVVVAVAVISLRPRPPMMATPVVRSTTTAKPAVTIMELNAAARQEGALDAVLARSAQETLPVTNRPNTALNALSKE